MMALHSSFYTSEAVTYKKFIAVKNPVKMNIYASPSGVCYIAKLDCSLLFPAIY